MPPAIGARSLGLLTVCVLVLIGGLAIHSKGSAQAGGAPPVQSSSAGPLEPGGAAALNRIAYAVDGAESSHGADPAMWRLDPDGPQGPMQVSAAAAADVGGGNRFDEQQNRALGRAYLALMYRRYGSWFDAVAAYNWGPGKMDSWISDGRPFAKLPLAVEQYRIRVLFGVPRLRFANIRVRQMAPDPYNGRAVVEFLYPAIISASEFAIR
jgi:hypothetical protein